jgi:hypothetical protein
MATKSPAEETSERKRISIPKADASVLQWWDSQQDIGMSLRILIRNEIERSGYADLVYRPVTQMPQRGRPRASEREGQDEGEERAPTPTEQVAAAGPVAIPVPVALPRPTASASPDLLDSIIGG